MNKDPMQDEKPQRRWHDDRGELTEAIDLLDYLPEPVIPMIAEGLTMKADKDFQAGEILKSLRSMGSQKIQAIHKSQQKRRSYDQDPNLHRIVQYFYILPDRNQERLAAQFVVFTGLVVDYLANCDSFGVESQENHLLELRTRFIEEGAESAQAYLESIHEPYFRLASEGVESVNDQPLPDGMSDEAAKTETVIVDGNKGMRIRKL